MPQYELPGAYGKRWKSLDYFTRAYIEAMFWTSCDDSPDCDPENRNVLRYGAGFANLTRASLAAIQRDCDRFRAEAGSLLDDADDEQAGHDFWLTREGHGAGFWARDESEYPNDPGGEGLSELARTFGEVTGDGFLYQIGRWVHYV